MKLDLTLNTICSTLFCTVKFCSDCNLVSSVHSLQEPTKCCLVFGLGLGFLGGGVVLGFCGFGEFFLFFENYFSLHSCPKS